MFDFENRDERRYHDRAAVLICASLLDHALETAILSYFVQLDQNEHRDIFAEDGPLSTFSAKIRLAYALGIFGPNTKKDLVVIQSIRNAIAHSRSHLNFQSPEIVEACRHISFAAKESVAWEGKEITYANDQYILACKWLCVYLFWSPGEPIVEYKSSDWEPIAN